jgi:hypothetical protein
MTPPTAPPDLEPLSRETGVPVDVLRTLAGMSDPANAHLFTAAALREALEHSCLRASSAPQHP